MASSSQQTESEVVGDQNIVTINVKSTRLPDRVVPLKVPLQARVLDIKKAIQLKFPGNPDTADQMLIYLGKVLQEDTTIVKEFIHKDENAQHTLHLVIKQQPAPQQSPPPTIPQDVPFNQGTPEPAPQTPTPQETRYTPPQVQPQPQQQFQSQPSVNTMLPYYHPVAMAAAHGAAMAAYNASMQAQGINTNPAPVNYPAYPMLMNQFMYCYPMPVMCGSPPMMQQQQQLIPQQITFNGQQQQAGRTIRIRPGQRARIVINPQQQRQQQQQQQQQGVNQNNVAQNGNQRAVRTMVLRINLRAIIQLLIVAVVLYQNSSPDRFILIMSVLIVLYFTAWGPIQRALQRAIEGLRAQQQQQQQRQQQQQEGGGGVNPIAQGGQPNHAGGGVLWEIWMILVGLFTSLLPGMNMNQEDAAIFAQAQEQIAREENQQQEDEREHQD